MQRVKPAQESELPFVAGLVAHPVNPKSRHVINTNCGSVMNCIVIGKAPFDATLRKIRFVNSRV